MALNNISFLFGTESQLSFILIPADEWFIGDYNQLRPYYCGIVTVGIIPLSRVITMYYFKYLLQGPEYPSAEAGEDYPSKADYLLYYYACIQKGIGSTFVALKQSENELNVVSYQDTLTQFTCCSSVGPRLP